MSGDILVCNTGSSSVKAARFTANLTQRTWARVEGIGTKHPSSSFPGVVPNDLAAAVGAALKHLSGANPPAAVGHRVVHGGTQFCNPVLIDREVRAALESLVPLAPLHQSPNLAGIDTAHALYPGVPMVACFDTAFHAGRPFVSEAYALPRLLYDQGVRRSGFHGLSYEYIVARMRALAPDRADGRLVVAHLGNGASLCAIHNGRSVETTMGLTALDGLPMSTRCGAIDPGVLLYLLREKGFTVAQLDELLWKQSGLLGVSGVGADMRDVLASDRPAAKDAVDLFVGRLVYFIGALAATLGGLDTLVFTAGIGENSAIIRDRVCRRLEWLGVKCDPAANAVNAARISSDSSAVSVWVIPTDEELMIARHTVELMSRQRN